MVVRLLSGAIGSWIFVTVTTTPATAAFALRATPTATTTTQRFASFLTLQAAILDVRGGETNADPHLLDPLSIQADPAAVAELPTDSLVDEDEDGGDDVVALQAGTVPSMSFFISAFARFYSAQIQQAPIRTKSITAGLIFGLSDFLAQRLENRNNSNKDDDQKEKKALDWTRLWTSVGVGFLYFGPAAHYWYEMIFRILPGTGLFSTLQKAALGQLIFGPSFTCIFFAASLWQSGKLTFGNWVTKIRDDLPGAWVAGLGYWPLVDLISYSLVPKDYIPLFVNACSLVWTIYLSLVANR